MDLPIVLGPEFRPYSGVDIRSILPSLTDDELNFYKDQYSTSALPMTPATMHIHPILFDILREEFNEISLEESIPLPREPE